MVCIQSKNKNNNNGPFKLRNKHWKNCLYDSSETFPGWSL